jgi:hypothetical protein
MSFSIKVVVTRTKDSEDALTVATRTVSGLTESYLRTEVLTSEAKVLWDATASGAIGNFDVLILSTDVEVEIEYTIANGDADEELGHFTLGANSAVTLFSDDARNNHSASDAFAGDADLIELIRAKEVNGTAATVTLELYT